MDDLRYARQACRAIARLLGSGEASARERGQRLREIFLASLDPDRALAAGSRRLDLAMAEPERRLQETREELARIIVSAGSR